MRTLHRALQAVTCLVMLTSTVIGADIPRMINYQAVITDDLGDPLNQNGVSFEFSVHDAIDFGTQLWLEGPIVKDIADGLLSHQLGSTVPLPDSIFARYAELWLGISVDGEALPRIQLLASGYAFRVSSVDSARGGTIAGEVSVEGASPGDQFSVTNSGDGRAGNFHLTNPASTEPALVATSDAFLGTAAEIRNAGGGAIARMSGAFVDIQDVNTLTKIVLNAAFPPAMGARISVRNGSGNERIELRGDWFGGGYGRWNHADGTAGVELDGFLGQLELIDDASLGRATIYTNASFGSRLTMTAPDSTATVDIKASETGLDGAEMRLKKLGGLEGIILDAEVDVTDGAQLEMMDGAGTPTILARATETGTDGAEIRLKQASGTSGIILDAETTGGPGGGGGGARIDLLNSSGVITVSLDSDEFGDGRVITEVLEITGGADLSEQFEVSPEFSGAIEPGMVLSIDPAHVGRLRVSRAAYDPTVAGIVSGAGGVKTGMLMGQSGSVADGRTAVALTGRVWCLADASFGKIEPGDLLTTSDNPGYAMKASDTGRMHGSLLGKAMSTLDTGTGLVLVLVSLQ